MITDPKHDYHAYVYILITFTVTKFSLYLQTSYMISYQLQNEKIYIILSA